MVPRRSYRRKNVRKVGRKYRYRKRYTRRTRVPRALTSNCHHFKEKTLVGVYSPGSVSSDLHFALTFSMNQLSNSTNVAAMYDQYRINAVVLTFNCLTTENTNVANYAFPGKLLVVRDTDDTSVLTSQLQYYEHQDCKILPLSTNRSLKLKVVPAVLNEVYRTAGATTLAPKFKQWVDMAHLDTTHYGVKVGICRNGFPADNLNWGIYTIPKIEVFATYYYSCKNQR